MKIDRAVRIELDPNDRQRTHFSKCAGTARFVWNWALAQRQRLWHEEQGTNRFTNAYAQHRELTRLKKTAWAWMYQVSKCIPQEALIHLDKAYNCYRLAKKAGRRVGLPQFKKRGKCRDSFSFTSGAIRCEGSHAVLPRMGRIRLKEPRTILHHIRRATVSRDADRWFVSFGFQEEIPDPAPVAGRVVGVDLGLVDFAVLSDGTRIHNPKHLDRDLEMLRRRSRQHSRKKRDSANRRRAALALARLHMRIKNRRRNFLHHLTTRLAKTKSVIVIEDLNVVGLRNGRQARAVMDASWGEFRRQLEYKCRWYGSRLMVAPRMFASSKTCHMCRFKNDRLAVGDRFWTCPSCGMLLDRDLNAALNLERLGSTDSSSGN